MHSTNCTAKILDRDSLDLYTSRRRQKLSATKVDEHVPKLQTSWAPTVGSPLWTHLLSEGGDIHVGQDCRIQRVHSFPRVAGGVGRTPVEIGIKSTGIHRAQDYEGSGRRYRDRRNRSGTRVFTREIGGKDRVSVCAHNGI